MRGNQIRGCTIVALSFASLASCRQSSSIGGAGFFTPNSGDSTVALGRLSPRGEKSVLIVPEEVLMRLTWNPFFPYLAGRVQQFVSRSDEVTRK